MFTPQSEKKKCIDNYKLRHEVSDTILSKPILHKISNIYILTLFILKMQRL